MSGWSFRPQPEKLEQTRRDRPPIGSLGSMEASSKLQPEVVKSDEQWCADLGEERFEVLRRGGTERPWSGELVTNHADGTYRCAGCGNVLFASDAKFDSACGWPSFTEPAVAEAVVLIEDRSHGMIRTEVRCRRCGGHLGHVFDDGPSPGGERWCINSLSLDFEPFELG